MPQEIIFQSTHEPISSDWEKPWPSRKTKDFWSFLINSVTVDCDSGFWNDAFKMKNQSIGKRQHRHRPVRMLMFHSISCNRILIFWKHIFYSLKRDQSIIRLIRGVTGWTLHSNQIQRLTWHYTFDKMFFDKKIFHHSTHKSKQ